MKIKSMIIFASVLSVGGIYDNELLAADAGRLVLEMGEESSVFETVHCVSDEYQTGNLLVEFDVTATGQFRGRPAIVLLSKSRPVEGSQYFQHGDMFLGELEPGQEEMSSIELLSALPIRGSEDSGQQTQAVMKKYKELAATTPPDKFGELMDAQQAELDAIDAAVKAAKLPQVRLHGTVTIEGKSADLQVSGWGTGSSEGAPEFQNLPPSAKILVTCPD